MGRIYLLRHGQATWQLDRKGDLDSPLTLLGHRQAEAAAHWFARQARDAPPSSPWRPLLVSSPLLRARQTTSYVAAALHLDEMIWPELAEAAFRVADHLPRRDHPADPLPPLSPRYRAFRKRAESALDRLYAASAGDRDVVAVTHGGMIRTMLRIAARSDAVCFDIPNATITMLEWRDGRWHVGSLGSNEHLVAGDRSR